MALLSLATLFQQWIDARQYAQLASKNIATVLQKDIERMIDTYTISLTATARQVENDEVMQLPHRLRDAILFDSMSTDASGRLNLGTAFVVDKDGWLIIDAQKDPPSRTNVADRGYFRTHRSDPSLDLSISAPIYSRLNPGQLVILLSRRINKPDGTFDGVVGMGIKLEYFTTLLSSVNLSGQSAVTLLTSTGTVIARSPAISTALPGISAVSAGLLQKINASADGSFVTSDGLDGVKRLLSFCHLTRVPMIITVAPSVEAVFASWWRRAVVIGTLMVVFSSALQLMSLLLMAELRSRRESEGRMRELARTDSLTGLATRRVFDEAISSELAVAKRSKRALALLFIDADLFKPFNDLYGHLAGDQALIRLAEVLDNEIRFGSDLAARYGGEEFVMILADTNGAAALEIAERIRSAVAELRIVHANSPTGYLSVSIGAATFEGNASFDVNALIVLADECLYQAKRLGRNQVYSQTAM
jgi:diguanylate cyclase (GGDEF)-like protein